MALLRIILCLFLLLIGTTVQAGPPIYGEYTNPAMDGFRFSESWKDGQEGVAGNTVNMMSWDGTTLGGQWSIQCAVAITNAQEVVRDIDQNGNGYIKYRTVVEDGSLWLSGNGPWGDGSEDYNLVVYAGGMTIKTTHIFVLGTRINSYYDISIGGRVNDFNSCWILTITGADAEGAGAQFPEAYPEYLDENCSAGTSVFGV